MATTTEAPATEQTGNDKPTRTTKANTQLALFEGKRYPNAEIKMAGGITGDAEFLLPEVIGLKVGAPFALLVHGVIAAKKHALTFDRDGEEVRTLVVTLKVDHVGLEHEAAS